MILIFKKNIYNLIKFQNNKKNIKNIISKKNIKIFNKKEQSQFH